MATDVKSKKGLLKLFQECSEEIQKHFEFIPSLVEGYPMEVALGYAFHRLELGQRMALYCGLINIHCADPKLARNAIDRHHMTRQGFTELYKAVFDVTLPSDALADLEMAEGTRDIMMHGGGAKDEHLRNAIGRVLEYAEAVNGQLQSKWKMKPFRGDWRGFSWRKEKLNPRTTRYMLKGMGFAIR